MMQATPRVFATTAEAEAALHALGPFFSHVRRREEGGLVLDNLEQYQPWTDENEIQQYDALAEAHGWDKSRFGGLWSDAGENY